MAFFPKNNNAKICMEPQDTSNSESKLDKEQSWSHHISWLQNALQSYNQNSKVLA